MRYVFALFLFLSSPAFSQTFTIGDTAIEAAFDNGNGGLVLAQGPYTAAQSGPLQSFSFYVITAAGQMYLGLFADNAGKPGALLATTAVFTPTAGWNTKPATSSPALVVGSKYWLIYTPSSNSLAFRKQNNSGTCFYFVRSFQALPPSWPTAGVNNCTPTTWSLYATANVSTAPPPPPANTALPVINGTPQVGSALTATNGSWSGSPTSFTYQWNSAGVAISGATNSGYTPQASDVGLQLTTTVKATNGSGSASATSAPTAAVTNPGPTIWTGTYSQDGGSSGTASCTEVDTSHLNCVLTPPLANQNNLTVGPVQ